MDINIREEVKKIRGYGLRQRDSSRECGKRRQRDLIRKPNI